MIDQRELEQRLSEAFAWRADHTIVETQVRIDASRPTGLAASGEERRVPARGVSLVAAGLVLVCGGVAIAGLTGGGSQPTAESRPPDVTMVEPPIEVTSSGRWTADADSGLTLRRAEDWDVSTFTDAFDVRIYATDSPQPEEGPALIVSGYEDIVGPPGPHPETVTVRGVAADLVDGIGGSRTLVFFVDGFIYSLTAFGMTDEQLVAVAESAQPSPDGYGAIIDPSLLPEGVTQQFVGWRESWFVSAEASAQTAPRVEFDGPIDGASGVFVSFADPRLARLSRLAYGDVRDVVVNGWPGYVWASEAADSAAVVWATGSHTVYLTGVGLNAEALLDVAESLRPASDEEWSAVLATSGTVL